MTHNDTIVHRLRDDLSELVAWLMAEGEQGRAQLVERARRKLEAQAETVAGQLQVQRLLVERYSTWTPPPRAGFTSLSANDRLYGNGAPKGDG